MAIREIANYNPIPASLFVVLWQFRHVVGDEVYYQFKVWIGQDRFENNEDSVRSLTFEQTLKGTEYQIFAEENEVVLEAANSVVRVVSGKNTNFYELKQYGINAQELIFTSKFQTDIATTEYFEKGDSLGGFTEIIQGNLEIVQGVGFACLKEAAKHNQFYAQILADVVAAMQG